MKAVCVLAASGEVLFTLNTEDYGLRMDDRIEANSVIYKVESVLFQVTVLPDAITEGEEGQVVLPGGERSWSTGDLFVTLSVVP